MLTLIIGGAASGKSEYAEALARQRGGPLVYIATLLPWDDECRRRIQKHQARRAGDGYQTLEIPLGLSRVGAGLFPPQSTVLLDCMGNLAANELYSPQGAGPRSLEEIEAGLNALAPLCRHLLVVSNEVLCGGTRYQGDTLLYLQLLARVNRLLARRADEAYEMVAGLPVRHK